MANAGQANANFGRLPPEILEIIFGLLPLRDKINSGFVCAHWNEVIGYNLKNVKIDASMPFGGRWVEENLRWIDDGSRMRERDNIWGVEKVWFRSENDPADKEMKQLIPKLCKLTNKIETLNVDNYHLDTESLTELLLSQTEIKTLRITIRNLPAWVKSVYFERIVEAIIRNQETIQVIYIDVETNRIMLPMLEVSVSKIQGIIACKGRLSFPRLKSLALLRDARTAVKQLLSNDFFGSLITSSKLIELRGQKDMMVPYIKNGNLRFLEKCHLRLMLFCEGDTDVDYDDDDLIKHCPHITDIDGCREYEYPHCYLFKQISAYGAQLKHFQCYFSREIGDAILEKCKNLKSLILYVDTMDGLLHLFGHLEKLTELDIVFISDRHETEETLCELIKRCGMNLQSLRLDFCENGHECHKIVNAIGANCRNLKNLKLHVNAGMQMIDTCDTRELEDSVESILEGCQKLSNLELYFDKLGDKFYAPYEKLGTKLPHLQHLVLKNLRAIPKPKFVKLIQSLPYCNITSGDIYD